VTAIVRFEILVVIGAYKNKSIHLNTVRVFFRGREINLRMRKKFRSESTLWHIFMMHVASPKRDDEKMKLGQRLEIIVNSGTKSVERVLIQLIQFKLNFNFISEYNTPLPYSPIERS